MWHTLYKSLLRSRKRISLDSFNCLLCDVSIVFTIVSSNCGNFQNLNRIKCNYLYEKNKYKNNIPSSIQPGLTGKKKSLGNCPP